MPVNILSRNSLSEFPPVYERSLSLLNANEFDVFKKHTNNNNKTVYNTHYVAVTTLSLARSLLLSW